MNTRELSGTYRGKVIDGGLGEATTGNEQVALLCELGGDGPEKGVRLTYYGSFTEKAVDHTIKALRAAGWSGTNLVEVADWKKSVPVPPDVDFVIEQEPEVDQNNEQKYSEDGVPLTRARVRWINAVGKIGLRTALSPDKTAAFAARMKGKFLAFDQSAGAPKTNGAPAKAGRPTPPPAGPPADPGDIPF